MLTVEDFRRDYTEFRSDVDYPDEAVQFWLDVSYDDLRRVEFAERRDLAVAMFIGHMLVLGKRNAATPGAVSGGAVSSRSVDKVSVSYDVSMLAEAGAGFWAMTSYGLRFWWMLRQRAGFIYRSPASRFGYPPFR